MLYNKTRKRKIIDKTRSCSNFICQGVGLTFRPRPHDFALIFIFRKEFKVAITMLFVFFPIDLLFLDSIGRVVEIKKGLRPFTNYCPENKAKYVIELPAGAANGVGEGDLLAWPAK